MPALAEQPVLPLHHLRVQRALRPALHDRLLSGGRQLGGAAAGSLLAGACAGEGGARGGEGGWMCGVVVRLMEQLDGRSCGIQARARAVPRQQLLHWHALRLFISLTTLPPTHPYRSLPAGPPDALPAGGAPALLPPDQPCARGRVGQDGALPHPVGGHRVPGPQGARHRAGLLLLFPCAAVVACCQYTPFPLSPSR